MYAHINLTQKKNEKKNERKKNCALCILTKRVKCKKPTKKQQHSNQFIKSKKNNFIKSTVTPFKQSLIQHYTS